MGFIGAEVAASLRQMGNEVTVVEVFETSLYRILGPDIGRAIEGMHRDRGVRLARDAGRRRSRLLPRGQPRAARELALDGDLILIHDPQPAALAALARAARQHWVWRCHIDLVARRTRRCGASSRRSWRSYDAAVFSHLDFVPPLPIPAYLVPPSIDPLSDKNRELDEDECDALLAPLGLPGASPG